MNKTLEISVSVTVQAGIHFEVDSAEWLAMTNDQRKKLVSDKLDSVSNVFANDVHRVAECTMSGEITSPLAGVDAINLDDVEAYDSESGDYDETHLNDGNPFDPESPEGRAWRDGDRSSVSVAADPVAPVAAAPTMRTYTFDINLKAATSVIAANGDQALEMVRTVFDCADCNGGAWPDGSPVLFEASLSQRPDIGAIDGEDVQVFTLRDWDELREREASENR